MVCALWSLIYCHTSMVNAVKSEMLVEYIRKSVIGRSEVVRSPFGDKPVVYADYTASGRALTFIEDYIRDSVLPLYANTHTESSGTGLQTSRFREEAREIVRDCVGASDEHAVLFCGSGATYAIDKLVGVMGLRLPAVLEAKYSLSDHIAPSERPVVFIGPFEHHSNELPWRESIADVVTVDEDSNGHVDLELLEKELITYQDRPLKIGSFSAASNVTGILTNTGAVSALLHRYGALSFWDFAAAAPYVPIDMASPEGGNQSYFDAIFISAHKLIGGPSTPGLLVARKELFANDIPDVPGGGTVRYVNLEGHEYLDHIEEREEGGTPAIVASIRAGLVFQLKKAVGGAEIRRREEAFVQRAINSWDPPDSASPGKLFVLGNREAERLSIVSFVVRHGEQYLHHNFVVAVLNDLFGIQSRGGCSCAGPYGHRLLSIDMKRSFEFQQEINKGCEGLKPGWVRINFNYFISEETFSYLVDSVKLVAEHGWRLLPSYRFEPETGLWLHRAGLSDTPMSLTDIDYSQGEMVFRQLREAERIRPLSQYLAEAAETLTGAACAEVEPLKRPDVSGDFDHLRWFPFPDEV